ncbi:hypothetical protein ASZ90_008629 [hydrocarbon metagenome]|uniref:Uncharacterized protein n=1 Tax=hydrocarbon metagenome TaxID=938273 RepID=A0A0W8FLA5_9ZZZZ
MTEIIFDKDEDWEKRILCSDGSCIGTIGTDGKCKECGKPYEGKLSVESIADDVRMVTAEESKEVSADAETDDWDKRVLCSDGSCIGVIGADGKCKECGKPQQL